jgi:alpha-ketoglutarate-dependent taurine dioxygenase
VLPLRQTAFSDTFGLIVEPPEGSRPSVLDLDPAALAAQVREHGALVLRGFDSDLSTFRELAIRFGTPVCAHIYVNEKGELARDREPVRSEDPFCTTVDRGQHGLMPHAEATYSPLHPEVVWFHCTRPADRGGQTGLIDGRWMFAELSEETAATFAGVEASLAARFPLPVLTDMVGVPLPDFLERLEPAIRARLQYQVTGDMIAFRYAVPLAPIQRDGRSRGFVNNILGAQPWFGVGTRWPLMDRIPLAAMHEAVCAAERGVRWIEWQAGDVAMIDNTRVLHCRRAFEGPREVATRMTFRLEV